MRAEGPANQFVNQWLLAGPYQTSPIQRHLIAEPSTYAVFGDNQEIGRPQLAGYFFFVEPFFAEVFFAELSG